MNTITKTLLLALFAMLCASCKHDDLPENIGSLPKETMIGANTFGCKINGEVWIPINDAEYGPGSSDLTGEWIPNKRAAWVVARNNHEANKETIVLRLENLPFASQFTLDVKNKYIVGLDESSCLLRDYKTINAIEYHTSPTRTGWVEITRLDTMARIIAGRFEFSMQMEGGDSVLNVTDGRFDIKF